MQFNAAAAVDVVDDDDDDRLGDWKHVVSLICRPSKLFVLRSKTRIFGSHTSASREETSSIEETLRRVYLRPFQDSKHD